MKHMLHPCTRKITLGQFKLSLKSTVVRSIIVALIPGTVEHLQVTEVPP